MLTRLKALSPELLPALLAQIKTPLFITDGQAETLLGWNPAYADFVGPTCSLADGQRLGISLPSSEVRTWLARSFTAGVPGGPEYIWSGLVPDLTSGRILNVTFNLFYVDRQQDLMAVSLQHSFNWLLSLSPDYLHELINQFPGALSLVDTEGRFLLCNKYLASLMGYTPEQLTGRYLEEVFPPPWGVELDTLIRNSIMKATELVHELDVTLSGLTRHLQVVLTPMHLGEKYIGSCFAFQDISHLNTLKGSLDSRNFLLQSFRQAAELLLADDPQSFDEVINQMLAAFGECADVDRVYIWSIHPSPYAESDELHISQLYEWSGGAEALQQTGYCQNVPISAAPSWIDKISSGQAINCIVKDMPDEERNYLEPQSIVSILAAPIIFQGTVWGFIGFDDCKAERVWTPTEENMLCLAGSMVGAAIHKQNINESLKVASADLEVTNLRLQEAAELARQANEAKSSFLASISHEIRTPLNAILGLTHLVRDSQVNAYQADLLDKADFAAETLLRIINDLLDFSKAEANKIELEHQSFYLSEVFERLRTLVGDRAEQKGLELKISLEPALEKTRLWGDALRLGQILSNLATNAIKFTERGRIAIQARFQSRQDQSAELFFQVSDTGIGLSPEAAARLFQPFTQADTSITRRYGGTGLGLVLCRKLAELMGGKIWCESVEGQGSNFMFTVKLEADQEAEPEKRAGAQAAGLDLKSLAERLKGARILVAEDNDLNQLVVKELLKKIQIQPVMVNNGQQAVEACQAQSFDLIFMDIQMPVMDGYTATELIRAHSGGQGPPIIAMTAHAMAGDREKSLEAGMNGHISKPFNPKELFSTLAQWL